jgi:hypothetical protein
MPLFDNAINIMRAHLEQLEAGKKASLEAIGTLTEDQLEAINQYRTKHGLPVMTREVVFIGSHIYHSRIEKDGYTIQDVIEQIVSAFDVTSTVITGKMTAIKNPKKRADRYGNEVRDEAVFECTQRYPRPELFSVVPRGDTKKPPK